MITGEMVTIKYGRIEKIRDTLVKLFNQRIPADVQYWLGRNVTSIAKATKHLEEERISILTQYGIKQPNQEDMYYIDPNNTHLKELLDKDVDVTIHKIEIGKLSGANLTQVEIRAIDFMLCEEKLIKVTSQLIQ